MTQRLHLVLASLVGATSITPAIAQGVINVAIVGEADTLDPMMSTNDVVSIVTKHIVETLYTFDSSWVVAPLLAAALPKISEDGKVYDIPLRTIFRWWNTFATGSR